MIKMKTATDIDLKIYLNQYPIPNMTLLALLSPIASLRGLDYDNIDYLYPEDISHSITPQLLSSFCHHHWHHFRTTSNDQKQSLHPEDISHHPSHTEHSDAKARERSVN